MTRAELAARLRLERPLAFFDLETTGVYPDRDRIVEITIIKLWPDGHDTSFSSLVNPTIPIPAAASEIHGITDAHVLGCRRCETGPYGHDGDDHDFEPWPTFVDLAPVIAGGLKDCDLAGYNIRRFDVPMLVAEFARTGVPFSVEGRRLVDPCSIFFKREPRNLEAALSFYCGGKALDGAHRTVADVEATIEVLAGQIVKYEDMPTTVGELHGYCKDPNWIDDSGRIVWSAGVAVLNFGANAGKALKDLVADAKGRDYLRWILSKNFPSDTQAIVRAALEGSYPKPPVAEVAA